jgi:hypothetical protein
MDNRIAEELRTAINKHSEYPELRELWLRVLGLQLLADDLSRHEKKPPPRPPLAPDRPPQCI